MDTVRKYGFTPESFPPSILDLGRVGGTLHFLPYSLSNVLLFYNEDAFERAGLASPPRTWDEVRDHARRVTEETDLLGLTVLENTDFWVMQGVMESNGAPVLVGSGDEVRCNVDAPEAVEATRFVAEMVLEDETALFDRSREGYDNFTRQRVAMLIGSNGSFAADQGFPYGGVPFPTFGDKPRRVPTGGHALGILAEDEAQREAAWELVRFLASPEALSFWLERTGYLPPRPELAEDPRHLESFYEKDPAASAAIGQLGDAVPWVSFPGENGLQARAALGDALDRIFTGDQEVASALGEAAQRVNELIAG